VKGTATQWLLIVCGARIQVFISRVKRFWVQLEECKGWASAGLLRQAVERSARSPWGEQTKRNAGATRWQGRGCSRCRVVWDAAEGDKKQPMLSLRAMLDERKHVCWFSIIKCGQTRKIVQARVDVSARENLKTHPEVESNLSTFLCLSNIQSDL
jgi:hypothetical protein